MNTAKRVVERKRKISSTAHYALRVRSPEASGSTFVARRIYKKRQPDVVYITVPRYSVSSSIDR